MINRNETLRQAQIFEPPPKEMTEKWRRQTETIEDTHFVPITIPSTIRVDAGEEPDAWLQVLQPFKSEFERTEQRLSDSQALIFWEKGENGPPIDQAIELEHLYRSSLAIICSRLGVDPDKRRFGHALILTENKDTFYNTLRPEAPFPAGFPGLTYVSGAEVALDGDYFRSYLHNLSVAAKGLFEHEQAHEAVQCVGYIEGLKNSKCTLTREEFIEFMYYHIPKYFFIGVEEGIVQSLSTPYKFEHPGFIKYATSNGIVPLRIMEKKMSFLSPETKGPRAVFNDDYTAAQAYMEVMRDIIEEVDEDWEYENFQLRKAIQESEFPTIRQRIRETKDTMIKKQSPFFRRDKVFPGNGMLLQFLVDFYAKNIREYKKNGSPVSMSAVFKDYFGITPLELERISLEYWTLLAEELGWNTDALFLRVPINHYPDLYEPPLQDSEYVPTTDI